MADRLMRRSQLETLYPALLTADGKPVFAETLDASVTEWIEALNTQTSKPDYVGFNPFLVSELIEAAFNRIGLAMQTRVRAAQIERDAYRDASDHQFRVAQALSLRRTLEAARALEPGMLRNQWAMLIRDGRIEGEYFPPPVVVQDVQPPGGQATEPTGGQPVEPTEVRDPASYWKEMFAAQQQYVEALEDMNSHASDLAVTPYGALNYPEQYAEAKKLFKLDMVQAYKLCSALRWSFKSIVKITPLDEESDGSGAKVGNADTGLTPFPLPKHPFLLDALYLWLRDRVDRLEAFEDNCVTTTVLIPFHPYDKPEAEGMERCLLKTKEDGPVFKFYLTDALLARHGIQSPLGIRRLLGADVWFADAGPSIGPTVWGTSTMFTGYLTVPQTSGKSGNEWDEVLTVNLPGIRSLAEMGDLDDVPIYRRLTNVDPCRGSGQTGFWTLNLDPLSVRQESISLIANLFLRLRIRHDAP